MKKVLFVNQVLFSKGHYDFDMKMIELLAKEYNLSIINPNDWYDISTIEGARIIPFHVNTESTGKIARFKRETAWNRFIAGIINAERFDLVFFVDFVDYLIVELLYLLKEKKRIAIMHHNSLDKIQSGVHSLLFNIYKEKVLHITLEEYMDQFLKRKMNTNGNNCHVIHHKLPFNSYKDSCNNVSAFLWNDKLTNIVALSSSNDFHFYNELYQLESSSGMLKKNGIRIVVKLKKLPDSYEQSDSFVVITERITDQDYWNIMNKADGALIYYEEGFKYRTSGYLSDAMYCHCPVIFRDSVMGNYYQLNFKKTCMCVKSSHDFYEYSKNIIEFCKNAKDDYFNKYLAIHSDESIMREVSKIV